jgi:hypothetical protein
MRYIRSASRLQRLPADERSFSERDCEDTSPSSVESPSRLGQQDVEPLGQLWVQLGEHLPADRGHLDHAAKVHAVVIAIRKQSHPE